MGESMNFFQAFPTSMKMLEQISEVPRDGLLKSHLLVLGARYRKSGCFGHFQTNILTIICILIDHRQALKSGH